MDAIDTGVMYEPYDPGKGFERITYLVRTQCGQFRVKDVDAFRTAIESRWPWLKVKENPDEFEDVVYLEAGEDVTIEDYPSDVALHWPRQRLEDGTISHATVGVDFDPQLLQTIKEHMRPQQRTTLYEVSYDGDDGEGVSIAVIFAERDPVQTHLDHIFQALCGENSDSVFFSHMVYPDDPEYPKGANGMDPVNVREYARRAAEAMF